MTDQDRLERLLRSALAPTMDATAARDLWPRIVRRGQPQLGWRWLDVGIAAAVAATLLMFPDWAWLLAYHL